MAQMTVPTLATWCAVYTIADQSSEPYLSYVLHEDEERIDGLKALLSSIDPPDPVPAPGARIWPAPTEASTTRPPCAPRSAPWAGTHP